MRKLAIGAALSAVVVVLGCPGGARQEGHGLLTGSVLYRSRISLPADSTVRVALVELSRDGASQPVLAEQEIATGGRQVPIPFELSYDPDAVDPGRGYGLRASISSDGEILFATAREVPVLTGGAAASGVEVLLDPVALDDPRAVISRAAAEIDASLDDMSRVEGEVEAGDTSSIFTAWFAPDGIRRLDEELRFGELGRGERAHWFLGGELVYAEVTETRIATDPSAPPGSARRVEIRLWFAPSGELLAGDKLVDGAAAELDPGEAEGVRTHAALVAGRAAGNLQES